MSQHIEGKQIFRLVVEHGPSAAQSLRDEAIALRAQAEMNEREAIALDELCKVASSHVDRSGVLELKRTA